MQLEQAGAIETSPLKLKSLPTPTPGPHEIRLRVRVCAVCHTDLHIAEGDLPLPKLPIVPGHQIVGVVDAIGTDTHRFQPGDRAGIPWLYSTDGTCVHCLSGDENLCDQGRFTGFHADGGYAEFCVIHEDFAHPIPDTFSDEHAAPLLCAGIIGYRSYRLTRLREKARLGLYGFGASAHLVLQLARHQGHEVYVFTRAEAHRALAKQLGAAWTGSAEDDPPYPLDGSIIFAPAGALVPKALRVLRKAGTLALAGITMSPIPEMDYALLYQERVVRSVANSTREDCREFLRLAAEIPIQTKIQMYDLDQANQALSDLKHSRFDGAAVLRVSRGE